MSANAMSHRMRPVALVAFVALAAAFIAATPASAQPSPVCLAGVDNALLCDYASLEQCRATASGGLGQCIVAPGYTSSSRESYHAAAKRHS
jgi:hypothetical protein